MWSAKLTKKGQKDKKWESNLEHIEKSINFAV